MSSVAAIDPPIRRNTDPLGLAACAAIMAFVLAVGCFKVDSLDTGYHLAYGGYFLDRHVIVDRDPFLYAENAEPFINANWGSQIVMALVYRAGGANGLIAVRLALLAVIFACIAGALRSFTSGSHWLAAAWLLAAVTAYERFSLRPELFSYAIMSLMLVQLLRGLRSYGAVGAMAFLQFAWVNLHSYFVVGILLTAAWLSGAAILWVARRDPEKVSQTKRLAVALLLQVGVCFVNPWSWRGAVFPLQTLSYLSRENVIGAGPEQAAANAWSLISEFHSPFRSVGELISGRTIEAYWVLLAVAAIGLVCNIIRCRLGPALFMLLLGVMSFQMRRNIAQFALAASPLAVGALAVEMGGADRVRRGARSLLLAACAGFAVWWTVGVMTGRFYYQERRISRQFGAGLSERTFAPSAVGWLADHPEIKPNLFVDYFSSSNALLWLPPRFKLFVDTNTFAYPEQNLATAFDLGLGKADHAETFDRLDINIVLLHCGPDTQALVRRLLADYTNWALVFFNRQAVIFVRRTPEHVPLIRRNQPSATDLDAKTWIAGIDEPACTKALSLGTAVNVPICLGWHAPAAELLEEAVRLAPDYHEAWYLLSISRAALGHAARKMGDLSQAVRHYQAALDATNRVMALAPSYNTVQVLQIRDDMAQNLRAAARR